MINAFRFSLEIDCGFSSMEMHGSAHGIRPVYYSRPNNLLAEEFVREVYLFVVHSGFFRGIGDTESNFNSYSFFVSFRWSLTRALSLINLKRIS